MGYASKVVARKKEWDDIWYLSKRKRLDISITIIKLIVIVDAHICALWGFYHVDNRYFYIIADFGKNWGLFLIWFVYLTWIELDVKKVLKFWGTSLNVNPKKISKIKENFKNSSLKIKK